MLVGGKASWSGIYAPILEDVEHPHILAQLALAAGAELVVAAGLAQQAGISVALFAVHGLALGRGVVVVLAPLGPVGIGVVAVEDDPLQGLHILRVVRIVAGHLEDQHPAARDLDPLETQVQAIHILRQFLLGKVAAVHHVRQQEGGTLHQSRVILVAHVDIPPIKIFAGPSGDHTANLVDTPENLRVHGHDRVADALQLEARS